MPVYLMFGLTFSSEYSLQIYNENLNAEGVLTARRPSLETCLLLAELWLHHPIGAE